MAEDAMISFKFNHFDDNSDLDLKIMELSEELFREASRDMGDNKVETEGLTRGADAPVFEDAGFSESFDFFI